MSGHLIQASNRTSWTDDKKMIQLTIGRVNKVDISIAERSVRIDVMADPDRQQGADLAEQIVDLRVRHAPVQVTHVQRRRRGVAPAGGGDIVVDRPVRRLMRHRSLRHLSHRIDIFWNFSPPSSRYWNKP